jgi:hypothetical protein
VVAATTLLSPDHLDYIIEMASKEGNPEFLKSIIQRAEQTFAEKGYSLPVKIEGFR